MKYYDDKLGNIIVPLDNQIDFIQIEEILISSISCSKIGYVKLKKYSLNKDHNCVNMVSK
jgi:hypothetical protein